MEEKKTICIIDIGIKAMDESVEAEDELPDDSSGCGVDSEMETSRERRVCISLDATASLSAWIHGEGSS